MKKTSEEKNAQIAFNTFGADKIVFSTLYFIKSLNTIKETGRATELQKAIFYNESSIISEGMYALQASGKNDLLSEIFLTENALGIFHKACAIGTYEKEQINEWLDNLDTTTRTNIVTAYENRGTILDYFGLDKTWIAKGRENDETSPENSNINAPVYDALSSGVA